MQLEFGGSSFYVDLAALDKLLVIKDKKNSLIKEYEVKETIKDGIVILTEKYEKTSPNTADIDSIKYDLIKMFIEYVIDFDTDGDDAMGAERALNQTPLGYKIVFNTLLNEGVIKEK